MGLQNHKKAVIIEINMVGVAQLVEHWVVAPVVVGSSPITHPIKAKLKEGVVDPLFYWQGGHSRSVLIAFLGIRNRKKFKR